MRVSTGATQKKFIMDGKMGADAQTILQRFTDAEALKRVAGVAPVAIAPVAVAPSPAVTYAAAAAGPTSIQVQPTATVVSDAGNVQIADMQQQLQQMMQLQQQYMQQQPNIQGQTSLLQAGRYANGQPSLPSLVMSPSAQEHGAHVPGPMSLNR